MVIVRAIVVGMLIGVFSGCSHQRAALPEMLVYEPPAKPKSIQGAISDELDEGMEISTSGEILIKVSGKPVLTLIDELAYKRRFNYIVEGNIPDTVRPEIVDASCITNNAYNRCGKMKFNNELEFFKSLILFLNTQSKTPFEVIQTSDGFKFRPQHNNLRARAFKKIFLFNLTSIEAEAQINKLFSLASDKPLRIVTIPSQNALVINEPVGLLDNIADVFYSIDADSPQVLIESRVFEYDDSINKKIGTAIQYAKKTDNNVGLAVSTVFGQDLLGQIIDSLISKTDTELKQAILIKLSLEGSDSGVKILAEPRLMVKPGKQSSIHLNSVKYISLTGVQTAQLEKINTGIDFKVTPTILSEKSILLELEIKQSEFLPRTEQGVTQRTNENKIITSIVVNDGELISLGGIYLEKADSGSNGIPYLKDIPVLGALFGTNTVSKSRSSIEFMIRPSIKNIKKRIEENQDKMLKFTKEKAE